MLLARQTIYTLCNCVQFANRTSFGVFSRNSRLWKGMKRSASGSGVMLRHLRYREKVCGQLDPPGVIELVVLGSGVNGTPKSFVVNTDHIRWELPASTLSAVRVSARHSDWLPFPRATIPRGFRPINPTTKFRVRAVSLNEPGRRDDAGTPWLSNWALHNTLDAGPAAGTMGLSCNWPVVAPSAPSHQPIPDQ